MYISIMFLGRWRASTCIRTVTEGRIYIKNYVFFFPAHLFTETFDAIV